MIFDLASEELHPEPGSFDVCIVGAGAAGITIAADLVGRGRRVLLLEAGGRGHELFSHSIYRSEVVGLPHTGIHEGRFRVIGGTTTEWGGQILELDDIDFQERSWIKGSGWPFGKAVLAPYYARALAFTGLDDAHEDREVWAALGIKPPYYGREFEPVFSRFMGERNFARRNDELLKHHPALTTVLHANLCGVSMAENGDAVRSVRCRAPNGKEAAFEAPFFIFALGGIESSRFFCSLRMKAHFRGRQTHGSGGISPITSSAREAKSRSAGCSLQPPISIIRRLTGSNIIPRSNYPPPHRNASVS